MCQFEGRMRRVIDTLLATRHGNFLCVCVCVYGCERMFEREGMLMSITERLSLFFSQWTGCSQGKQKTHEASCLLPTGNIPACTCTCTRTPPPQHTHAHTQTHIALHIYNSCFCSKSLMLLLVLFLSFMFRELLDWIMPSLVSVWYSGLSVMSMTSQPYPMVCYIPTQGTARLQRFTTQLNGGWGAT